MYGDVSTVYSDKSIRKDFMPNQYLTGSWGETIDPEEDFLWKIINTPSANRIEDQILIISWETEDSFTQIGVSPEEEDQVNRLLLSIRMSNQEDWANRLFELHNMAKEDDPDYLGISSESLKNFYSFLQKFKNVKLPKITLTDDHNIYTSWKNDNFLFSMHFLPKRKINFVIFKTNDEHPEKKDRLSGTVTIDTIEELISQEILNDWIKE